MSLSRKRRMQGNVDPGGGQKYIVISYTRGSESPRPLGTREDLMGVDFELCLE